VAVGVFGIAAGALLAPATTVAGTGINNAVNFQGKLVNTDGTNITDGTYNIEFKMYTGGDGCVPGGSSSSPCGGTLVWTEDWLAHNSQGVVVTDGLFQLDLGTITALPNVFNTDTVWLSINLGNTSSSATTFASAGGDGEMLQFIRFTAAPYAINSDMLGGLHAADFAQLSPSSAQSGYLNVTGNVTSGATVSGTTVAASTGLQAPLLDTASAVTLNIGTGTASGVTIGRTSTPFLIQGNAGSTFTATASGKTTTIGFTSPTQNTTLDFPASTSAGTYTICTTDVASCGSVYATGGSGSFLARNSADTSTAAITAANYLYGFTNSSSAVASGVLELDNGSNTGKALYVTASGNPGSGNALIVANNTAGSPSGNLLDLQKAGASEFSVDYNGNLTQNGGSSTTDTVNGQRISSAASFTGSVTAATSVLAPLVDTASAGVLNIGTTNATGINLNQSTTVASGKNLTLTSGQYSQTYSSATAGNGQTLSFSNTNTGAGVTIQGIDMTPTNTSAPSSGTNTLNVEDFAVGGALGANDTTNGINFESATGYTNFINTPTFVLSSGGAVTGATGISMASGNFLQSGGGSFTTGSGAVQLNGSTTIASGANLTLTSGSLSQTYSSGAASNAQTLQVTNSNSGGSSVAVNGDSISLVGTATSGGTNTNSAMYFTNPTAQANNIFNGLNFAGTGYNNVLVVNGSSIINGSGVLQNAGLSGTYSNALTLSNVSNAFTGTYNNLSLATAADGFTVAGGTTSRTLTVTGADITIGSTIKPTAAGALTVQSNGANALSIDTGGAAALNIAGANANAVNVGNGTSNPTVAFNGSGTFGTTTGQNNLNGNTVVASGKTLQVTSGLTTLGGGLTVTNAGNVAFQKTTDISTTGTLNDQAITGALVRFTGGSAQTLTGIAGGADGRIITLVNAAGQALTVKNNDTVDSAAANVIITGTGGDLTIPAGSSLMVVYDSGASVWRVASGSVAATGGYIQNQNSAVQTGNFWISGAGRADTSFLAPTLDTATGVGLNIGNTTATAIGIGRSGITTTVTGGLTQLTGAVSLSANGASNFTTSAGALTLTSNQAATWSTANGDLTLQAGSGTVSLGSSGTLTNAGALAVTGGTTLTLNSNGANTVSVDTGGGAAINVGGTNATSLVFGNTSSNPTVAFNGSGTFGTTTGQNSLNGNTVVVSNKSFTADGSALFQDATNSTTAFQIQSTGGANILTGNTTDTLLTSGANFESTGYFDNGIGGIGQFGNLLQRSEQFDAGAWTKNLAGTAATADQVAAPDGQTTADKIHTTTNGGNITQSVSGGNNTYTFSVWLKTGSGTQSVDLRIDSNGTPPTGTAKTVTATTTWQRFFVTQTFSSGVSTVTPTIFPGGTGGQDAVNVYAWGGQLVQASNPEVYVRTTGAAVAANAGVVSNGGEFISSANSGDVPLAIQGDPSQTGDLVQLQNSSGTALASFTSAGSLKVAASLDTQTAAGLTIGSANATSIGLGNTTSNIATTINGTALVKPTSGHDSTTAFQVQNAGGSALLTADTTNTAIVLGKDASPVALTVRGGAASGSNVAGANITFDASNGTGNQNSGDLIFRTGAGVSAALTNDSSGNNNNACSASTTSCTWSYTVPATNATTHILLVGVTLGKGSTGGTSTTGIPTVTYAGSSMTRITGGVSNCDIVTGGTYKQVCLFYLVNPATGANNVVASVSPNGANWQLGAATFYNVDQTTPIGNSNFAIGTTSPASSTINTNSTQVVVDAVGINNHVPTNDASQTNLYTDANNTDLGASYKAAGASTTTMQWTFTNAEWGDIAVALNPVTNTSADTLIDRLHITASGNVGIGAASPTANLQVTTATNTTSAFQVQNAAGAQVFTVDTSSNSAQGQVVLGKASTNMGRLVFDDSGSANTGTIVLGGTLGAGATYNLPTTTGTQTICTSSTSSCSGAGSGYIVNGTSTQTGNYNIQSAAAGSVGGVIQGASSQTADLLDLRDSTGANVLSVAAGGNQENLGYFDNGIGGVGQFSNLVQRSEQFDNGAWSSTDTVTADQVAAPDGQTTADKLHDTSSGQYTCQFTSTAAASTTFTYSVWLKTGSGTQNVDLRVDGGATSCATAATVTGTVKTVTATTTWQRYFVTQAIGTCASCFAKPFIYPGGTGGSDSVNVYAWGGQLVADSNPEVYVRTTGAVVAANAGVVSNGGDFISSRNASDVPLQIQGDPSQSGDLIQAENSSGTPLFKVASSGAATIAPTANSAVSLTVKGTTGTAADVIDIYNSAGTPTLQDYFDSAGKLNVGQVIQPTSNNAIDLGLTGTRFRTAYLGTSVSSPSYTGAGAVSLTSASGSALTITGDAASTWSTTTGNLTVDAAAALQLGTSNATSVKIGKSTTTTEVDGTLKVGGSAGAGAFLNNGATTNTELALGDFAAGGSIGSAASTVDIYTYISVAQTHTGQALTISSPTASTTYGKLVYLSNIGTASFTLLGSTLSPGSTATLVWANKNGGAAWTYAGADGSSILNQNAATQTANFLISGTGEADTSVLTPLLDTPAGTTTLNIATTNATAGINLNQSTTVAAGKNLSLASGSGTFSQTYTGAGDAHSITANSLTTGTGLKVTTSNNTAANTSWSAVSINTTNAQGTTAVSGANLISGLDIQFTQNTSVAGNNETVANFAIAQNNSSSTDSAVGSIVNVSNNDTATGNQITATAGVKINGSNVTDGLYFNGTFGTNLINSSTGNFVVTQGGAVTAGAIQGTTINATTNFQANGNAAVGLACGAGQVAVASTWTEGILTTAGTCQTVPVGTFLAKNSADTSSAAITAAGYLYGFTNSSSAVASGVLSLDNGSNTADALYVTAAGSAGSGNALIVANSTLNNATGNLLDLQSKQGGTSASRFSVDTSGNVTLTSGNFDQSGSGGTFKTGTGAVTLGGNTTVANGKTLNIGSTAGNSALVNNGATTNTEDALGNFATGGSIGTAATTVDIYTYISVAQTTAGQTITIPAPTAATTYGKLLYVSNVGTASFTMLGTTISTGTTATLVWANKNGGAAWTFAGADGSSILNQSAADQTADFRISGVGRANTKFTAPLFDTITASQLNLGTGTANAVSIGSSSVTTTVNGTAEVGTHATAGTGALLNNGSTTFSVDALSNFATGGNITTAAVDAYTYISVNQTTAGQTIGVQNPTANTTYGKIIFVSNIGTASFSFLGITLNTGSTATLVWANKNGGAGWTFAGADANGLQAAYNNSGTTDPQIQLDNTNKGLKIRDAASSTITNLLDIADSAGTTHYLQVTSAASTFGGNISLTSTGAAGTRTISVATQTASNTAGDALNVTGATGNGSGTGGALALAAGAGGATGAGGAASLTGGAAGGGNNAGGNATVQGGAATGSGTGGTASLLGGSNSGSNNVSAGGAVAVTGANGSGSTTNSVNAAGGGAVTITSGSGGSASGTGTTGGAGADVTLQAGAGGSGVSANGAGGNISLTPGFGPGTPGVVKIDTPVYTSTTDTVSGATLTISQTHIDQFSTDVITDAANTNATVTVNNPGNTTAGRTLYIASAAGNVPFYISMNSGALLIYMTANTTAQLVWNGTAWTGSSADTSLQGVYNDTSAAPAGIVTTSSSKTLYVQSGVSFDTGNLLTVNNSFASVDLGVSTNTTNLILNPSIEANPLPGSGAGNWTYSGAGGGSVARGTTNVYSGAASLTVVATTTNDGAKQAITNASGTATALTASTKYMISWYANGAGTAVTNTKARYSYDGTTGNAADCDSTSLTPANGAIPSTTGWTRYWCTFTTGSGGTAPTTSNAIFIVMNYAPGSNKTFYIDAVQLVASASGLITPYQETSLALNGLVTSPVSVENTQNSTNAFAVQNANGGSVAQVDTLDSAVGINLGTDPIASGYDLEFGGNSNRAIGVISATTANQAGGNLTINAGGGNGTGGGGTLALKGGAASATAGSAGGPVTINGTNGAGGAASTAAGGGGAITITTGTGGAGSGASSNGGGGGTLTLQAGAGGAAGSSGTNAAGGGILIQAGAGGGTTGGGGSITLTPGGCGSGSSCTPGVVNIDTPVFTSVPETVSGASYTIVQSDLDSDSTIVLTDSSFTNATVTVPNPSNTTAGRTVYIASANSNVPFFISMNSGGLIIYITANTTAQLVWNGAAWTASSADTSLQGVYNDTQTSPAVIVTSSTTKNILFQAGSGDDNSSLFAVEGSAGSSVLQVDTTNTNAGLNLAQNGGVETGGTPPTGWAAHGGAANPTQTTTASNFASGTGGISEITTASAGQGVRNLLNATALADLTTYNVSFSVKAATATITNANLVVAYYNNNTPRLDATCSTPATPTISTTAFIKYTCQFTTSSSSNVKATTNFLAISQNDAVARTLLIDNLSVVAQNSTGTQDVSDLQVGGPNSQGLTLLTLDTYAGTPWTGNSNTTLLGSMYFDTTAGELKCYDTVGWGSCGPVPNQTINLVAEYAGAVLNGSGTNNTGTMTANFCSGSSLRNIEPDASLCAASEQYNYYRWTSTQSANSQTFDIYVRYQLPSTFKTFSSTPTLVARTTDSTNGAVTFSWYNAAGTSCGSAASSSNNAWQTLSPGTSGCAANTFSSGDIILFKIETAAKSSSIAYASDLVFTMTGK
jgi:hypothetical protein